MQNYLKALIVKSGASEGEMLDSVREIHLCILIVLLYRLSLWACWC